MEHIITDGSIDLFGKSLAAEERSSGTIGKYLRDIKALAAYLAGQGVTHERLCAWKADLLERDYKPTTINSMLASANAYCRFAGLGLRIRFLRLQKQLFRDEKRELGKHDYEKLIDAAQKGGKARLALLLETIAGTGIRVSEVKYITLEAAVAGKAQIALKGKIRVILIPKKLRRKLIDYAKKHGITAGEIFITRNKKTLSRKQIWAEMKKLCAAAGVAPGKVFPHNLRHLFARTYYGMAHDIAKLADLLGHSSIETTRIYLLSTGEEHARQIEKLGLVS